VLPNIIQNRYNLVRLTVMINDKPNDDDNYYNNNIYILIYNTFRLYYITDHKSMINTLKRKKIKLISKIKL